MNSTLSLFNLLMNSNQQQLDQMLGTIFGAKLEAVVEDAELKGMRLVEVTEGGTAENIGLCAGDIIVTVCNCPVSTLDNVQAIMAICEARQSGQMNLGVVRCHQVDKSTAN